MAEMTKTLNTRLALKIDTLENWNSSTLGLLKGEIAIATVAASAGTGLTEPVCMIKIGEDGVKTFSQLDWTLHAKASDVIDACKSTEKLTAFVNNLITGAGMAKASDVEALTTRVGTAEGDIDDLELAVETLNGDAETEGSVAKAIKDAIDALDLENTYVAQEDGKSLIADTEIARLAAMSDGANKVEKSNTNGNIKVDGAEVVVYTHPDKHTKADIADFEHTHVASEITDFATEVAKVKVDNAAKADEATKATQDGNGDVIADTYAKKATTLAGYGIGDAYTKTEVDGEIEGAISTFVSAYITSDGGAIDKLQEIANWIDSDKDGAADIIADVEDHATRLDTVEETLKTHGDIVSHNVSEFYTKEQADAAFTDSTEVDAQIDAKIEALDLGTMSKETATDYVKKSEATGYDDILTKTEAATAYQAKGEYYTKTEADAAFTDSTEVDAQIDAKIEALDLDNTYQAKGDYASAAQGAKADTAIQSVTSVEGNGLKATTEGTAVTIDWDPNVVFIFDCGDSGVVTE